MDQPEVAEPHGFCTECFLPRWQGSIKGVAQLETVGVPHPLDPRGVCQGVPDWPLEVTRIPQRANFSSRRFAPKSFGQFRQTLSPKESAQNGGLGRFCGCKDFGPASRQAKTQSLWPRHSSGEGVSPSLTGLGGGLTRSPTRPHPARGVRNGWMLTAPPPRISEHCHVRPQGPNASLLLHCIHRR